MPASTHLFDVDALVAELALAPHPEGGWFRRFHASQAQVEAAGVLRPAMTAIHYLLAAGGRSEWHRIDADEAWHWQRGAHLGLLQFDPASGRHSRTVLGPSPDGQVVSCIVPAGHWQAARAPAGPVLVTCTVAPGFVWEGFELVDPASPLATQLRAGESDRDCWRSGARMATWRSACD